MNLDERALASGTAWFVVSMARLGLHLHGRNLRVGKGIWYLGCFDRTGFKQDSEFFPQDITNFYLDVLQFFRSVFHIPHVAVFFSLLLSSLPYLSLSTFCFFLSFPSSL